MPKRSARKKRNSRNSKKRSSKRKKQRKAKIKRYSIVALLFAASSLFLGGYLLYKKVTQEFASAFSVSSQDLLSREIFSSALVVTDDFKKEPLKVKKVSLYIFDKSTLKTIVYNIPVETTIDVPGRFSEEPFSNILALGNLEEAGMEGSAEIMTKSIFKLMAFPVDRYVLVEQEAQDTAEAFFRGSIKLTGESDLIELKDMIKTNHSLRELFDIYKFSNSLPKDRVILTKVGETYLSKPALLDEELMNLTFDSVLSREKKSIAVLNGTNHAGVASFGSRVVRNLGGRVVATANTNRSYEKSVLIVDETTAESTRIISQIFNIDRIVLRSDLNNFDENEIDRSDITIIFGLDFAGSL